MSSNITATAAAEACRVALFAEWVTSNSLELVVPVGELQSIVHNDMFAIAESFCEGYIKAYNTAAGRTCILQQQWSPSDEDTTNITYTDFWEGAGNMDGSYTLAEIFSRTDNFTLAAQSNFCNNDCYVSAGGLPGCIYSQSIIPLVGQISQSHVCYNEWSGMDKAYNELRVCAATAIYNNNTDYDNAKHLTEKVTVQNFQDQRDSSVSCALMACPTTPKSESTRLIPPGGRRGGFVIIVSSLMMLFLLI
jgi:hypothetical protein